MNFKGEVVGLLCVSRDVTQKARLEQDLRDALKREQLLAQEMRHRIKNVFSVVSGLIVMAEREAIAEGTPFTPGTLQDRLYSLARASDAVFDKDAGPEGDQRPVDIKRVITSVLEPYLSRCELSGHDAHLGPNDVTPIALFLHELATNSVKYGALGADQGRVSIGWTSQDALIQLTWVERNGPRIMHPPAHQGFGTSMVDRVIRSANGKVERHWSPDGLSLTLSFPGFTALPLSA
jgi:two-component sensor histidine kinase